MTAASQLIALTALPNGADDSGLRLSLVLSPRLESPDANATLAQFPAWSDWPAIVAQLSFMAFVRKGPADAHVAVALKRSMAVQVDGSLWKKVFPPTTPIKADEDSSGAQQPAAYDVKTVRDTVRELYASYAAARSSAFADPALIQAASTHGGRLGAPASPRARVPLPDVKRYTAEDLAKHDDGEVNAMSLVGKAFRQLQAFHLPPPTRQTAAAAKGTLKAEALPEHHSDFHEIATAVAQYPHLQRRLCFVLDFHVDPMSVPSGDLQISVVASGPPTALAGVDTKTVSLWTSFRHSVGPTPEKTLFRSLALDGSVDGFLNLRGPRIETAVEDVDTGAYHILDYNERIEKIATSSIPGGFDDSLPALRTKGIQFFNLEMGSEIAAAQARTDDIAKRATDAAVPYPSSNPTTEAPILSRHDLVRGYRVDVLDSSEKAWRSLCERRSTVSSSTIEEEGFVSEAVASAHPLSGADRKTSQIIFRWNGWSLVAPRPGGAAEDDGTMVRDEAESILHVVDRPPAKGLPRLRFGRSYTFRCREADLAGNGWTTCDPGLAALPVSAPTSEPLSYLRHEPVGSPVRVGAGSSNGATKLVVGLRGDRASHPDRVWLQPPSSTLDMVVKHGVFDGSDPVRVYEDILSRVGMPDGHGARSALSDPAYGGVVATPTWPAGRALQPINVAPDHLDVSSRRVQVRARPGATYRFTSRSRGITIEVPPGRAAAFAVASFIQPRTRALFQTHGSLAVEPGSPAYDLIAPKAQFVAVHPVERPLAKPSFGPADDPELPVVTVLGRNLGETHARFADESFRLDVESTGHCDIFGEWEDVTDVASSGSWPTRTRSRARLFGFDVQLPPGHPLSTQAALSGSSPSDVPLIDPATSAYDFRDTKYRRVTLTAQGVTRFMEFFERKPEDPTDRFLLESEPTTVQVRNTKPPRPPKIAYVIATLSRGRTRSGRQQRLTSEGWGIRVYLEPGDWFDSGDGEQIAVLFAQSEEHGSLSQIGGDPILISAPVVNDLGPSDFSNHTSQHANLRQLRGANTKPDGTTAADRADYAFVSAASFEVKYDPEKRLLFADLIMRRRVAYRPFVRLALSRFQPVSVDGAHLSSVVFADFIQLSPERTLTIVRDDGAVRLRVMGSFPHSGSAVGPKTLIVATAQSAGLFTGSDQIWREDGSSKFALRREDDDLEHSVWTCAIPTSTFRGCSKRRIVIEEWEVWDEPGGQDPATGRLVYSEEVSV